MIAAVDVCVLLCEGEKEAVRGNRPKCAASVSVSVSARASLSLPSLCVPLSLSGHTEKRFFARNNAALSIIV